MQRYGIIEQKRKREIVLLRGKCCIYGKCAFCDYFKDRCSDEKANFRLNADALANVSGIYADLEVINSGSVFELDEDTLSEIERVCKIKGINTIHFEAHYLYRDKIPALRKRFKDFQIKMKLGLETFDYRLREEILNKGIKERDAREISKGFDEVNLLFGIEGQSADSMINDIELALAYFQRVCVNVMCENSTDIKPDKSVIEEFMKMVYPIYIDDGRIDILINNTDFGVGD